MSKTKSVVSVSGPHSGKTRSPSGGEQDRCLDAGTLGAVDGCRKNLDPGGPEDLA